MTTKSKPLTVSTDKPKTPQVYWAVPMGETINVDAFRSLLGVAQVCGAYHFNNIPIQRMRTDLARNTIVSEFLKVSSHPDDVLIMLDNDHVHPATIVRDLAEMDHDFGVTGALAYRRGKPFDPVVFIRTEQDGKLHPIATWEEGSLIQCHMVAHGAIAIKRWVFEKLIEAGYGPNFYQYQYRADGTQPSEDMYFGEACEKLGIWHYCRTDLLIPHITNYFIDGEDWRRYLINNPGSIRREIQIDEPEQIGIGALSIVIPSKGRPDQLCRLLEQIKATTQGASVETLVIAGADDCATISAAEAAGARVETMPLDHNAIEAWNYGAARAAHDWLMLGADDLWFEQGWLDDVNAVMNKGFIGLPDGHTDQKLATHYIATKEWLRRYNGGNLAIPVYKSWYIDTETSYRAHNSQTYAFCKSDRIEHRHIAWKTAQDDATYQRGRAFHEHDKQLFSERQKNNFPDDFEAVL